MQLLLIDTESLHYIYQQQGGKIAVFQVTKLSFIVCRETDADNSHISLSLKMTIFEKNIK